MKLKTGLVMESLPDGGCLVIDEEARQSHALAAEAAQVTRCLEQGDRGVPAIVRNTGLEQRTVEGALAQLEAAGLLEADGDTSRREWLARAATVAGAAVGLKLIETIATPSPAEAQSLRDSNVPV